MQHYSHETIKVANATSRGKGAVGKNAIVPRIVREYLKENPDATVLDYGAGKHALHARKLKEEGFNVTAYDFGENAGEWHDPDALIRTYDVIYASNVVNTINRQDELGFALREIALSLSPEGVGFLNYPRSPRKTDMTNKDMEEELTRHFCLVERVKEGVWRVEKGQTNKQTSFRLWVRKQCYITQCPLDLKLVVNVFEGTMHYVWYTCLDRLGFDDDALFFLEDVCRRLEPFATDWVTLLRVLFGDDFESSGDPAILYDFFDAYTEFLEEGHTLRRRRGWKYTKTTKAQKIDWTIK